MSDKPIEEAKAKERQQRGQGGVLLTQNSSEAKGETRQAIADLAGVSHDTIRKVEAIKETATPEGGFFWVLFEESYSRHNLDTTDLMLRKSRLST